MVNWNVTEQERKTIRAIAERAWTNVEQRKFLRSLQAIQMDITAVHANICPLWLEGLLAASEHDFSHDINGIRWNLDRRALRLQAHFWPRFATAESSN